jgi:hypothetical protein
MRLARDKSSVQQMAYARRIFGGQGKSKKEIALDCGYSPAVANSVKSHIENKDGYQNAVIVLATESNNLALAALAEFKRRGFKDFSDKNLIGALNAIGSAWEKFNRVKEPKKDDGSNKLRTVIMQQIENQTINSSPADSDLPIVEATAEIIDVNPEEQFDF